ncbi:unnamed protein product [Chrysoparadoxa australica]
MGIITLLGRENEKALAEWLGKELSTREVSRDEVVLRAREISGTDFMEAPSDNTKKAQQKHRDRVAAWYGKFKKRHGLTTTPVLTPQVTWQGQYTPVPIPRSHNVEIVPVTWMPSQSHSVPGQSHEYTEAKPMKKRALRLSLSTPCPQQTTRRASPQDSSSSSSSSSSDSCCAAGGAKRPRHAAPAHGCTGYGCRANQMAQHMQLLLQLESRIMSLEKLQEKHCIQIDGLNKLVQAQATELSLIKSQPFAAAKPSIPALTPSSMIERKAL